jgi:hypothetical protein
MKKLPALLILSLLLTGFYSCKKIAGKGALILENRMVTGYQSVSLSMDAVVNLQIAQEYSLQVRAQENLMPYIETVVSGDRLDIRIKNNYILGKHEPITVTITAPNVNDFDVNGSGDILVSRPLTATNLGITISGSGWISIDSISVTNLESMISGSGNINITTGTASRSDHTISGSGMIEAGGVVSDKVYANISGSGNIYCHAEAYLNAIISGSGNIYYLGSPVIDTQISGSGSLIHL